MLTFSSSLLPFVLPRAHFARYLASAWSPTPSAPSSATCTPAAPARTPSALSCPASASASSSLATRPPLFAPRNGGLCARAARRFLHAPLRAQGVRAARGDRRGSAGARSRGKGRIPGSPAAGRKRAGHGYCVCGDASRAFDEMADRDVVYSCGQCRLGGRFTVGMPRGRGSWASLLGMPC